MWLRRLTSLFDQFPGFSRRTSPIHLPAMKLVELGESYDEDLDGMPSDAVSRVAKWLYAGDVPGVWLAWNVVVVVVV